MPGAVRIRRLEAVCEPDVLGLSEVLLDCVQGGASVSFLLPLSHTKAEHYWRGMAADIARGRRIVLVAEDAQGGIIGTVSVVLDLPENQPHRGDISKMLVHRRARRWGVGAQLLAAAERSAAEAGRSLLVLDTAGTEAARLYERAGWQRCGRIPYYALMPDGAPCATTVYFKLLHDFHPYAATDMPGCLAVFDANCPAFFAANERADYAAFLLHASAGYTVCRAGGHVAGAFGLTEQQPGHAILNWILISPHLQGSGIGSAMMHRARDEARSRGASVVSIAASHRSAPFFEKFGGQRVSETADGWGPGMHRIDMQWMIGATP